jgi:hypothetical protein
LKVTIPLILTASNQLYLTIFEHNPLLPYDIFSKTNANFATNWTLHATGVIGQTNYYLANIWGTSNNVFFAAGSGADLDGDGWKDGDEALVRRTNPYNFDSDGDGMPDGWEISKGLNPLVNDAFNDPDGDGLQNYRDMQPFTFNSPPTITFTKPSGTTIY